MIDKIGIAAATVVQSGNAGPVDNEKGGFAEELSKQLDDQNNKGGCGNNSQNNHNVSSVETPTA